MSAAYLYVFSSASAELPPRHHIRMVGALSRQVISSTASKSGLLHAHKLLRDIEGIALIDFDKADIIRHKLVERIVNAYEKDKK